jgi:hypothetical protein
MVTALCNTRLQDVPRVPQALSGPAERQRQGGQVRGAEVAQFNALEVVPEPLGRVELPRVAGRLLQEQALRSVLAQDSLMGWPRWIGAPSQTTSSWPRIFRTRLNPATSDAVVPGRLRAIARRS